MSKFKDVMNRYRTESLFLEMIQSTVVDKYDPLYTLRPGSRKGLPSAYDIYMDSDSEYEAAIRIVGEMKHWRRLCKLKWFMEGSPDGLWDGLKQWRLDKAEKDQNEAIKLLKEQAQNGNVTAQKTLLDHFKKGVGAGRPRKEKDTSKEDERLSQIVELHKEIQDRKNK